jgi:hypothetical protein
MHKVRRQSAHVGRLCRPGRGVLSGLLPKALPVRSVIRKRGQWVRPEAKILWCGCFVVSIQQTNRAGETALLKRCLDRNVKTRLHDIGETRVAIQKWVANPASLSDPTLGTGAHMLVPPLRRMNKLTVRHLPIPPAPPLKLLLNRLAQIPTVKLVGVRNQRFC